MKKNLLLLFACFLFANGYAQYANSKVANVNTPGNEKSQRINNTKRELTAPTPPMGWNSWNNFGCDIKEAEFRSQVDYVANKLRKVGYQYMTVDISWYSPSVSADPRSPFHHPTYARHDAEMDAYGRFLPAKNKFPSAVNGSFRSLADYVHSKGLKFGLHIMRGIPWQAVEKDLTILGTNLKARDIANPADVCLWYNATYGIDMSKPGAQEYYNSIFKLYASWGVDFIKVDDLSMPYHADEITAVRKAIEQCGRKIVFSTSPGSTPLTARYHILTNADMFRISADFWDNWKRLKEQFTFASEWAVHAVNFPGHWPDLDMIPFGKIATRSGDDGGERFTRFTKAEQYTLMSLWCIAKSPLIIGNDITQNDAFTDSILSNEEVIAVNQHGINQRQVADKNGQIIWESSSPNKTSKYAALFNQNDADESVVLKFDQIGLEGKCSVRDLWAKKELGAFEDEFAPQILQHCAGMYEITQLSK
jgi:alpha-galactosidase